jgi:hypothetical protein
LTMCGVRKMSWCSAAIRPWPDPSVERTSGRWRNIAAAAAISPRLPCFILPGSGGEPPYHLSRALPVHGEAHQLAVPSRCARRHAPVASASANRTALLSSMASA